MRKGLGFSLDDFFGVAIVNLRQRRKNERVAEGGEKRGLKSESDTLAFSISLSLIFLC